MGGYNSIGLATGVELEAWGVMLSNGKGNVVKKKGWRNRSEDSAQIISPSRLTFTLKMATAMYAEMLELQHTTWQNAECRICVSDLDRKNLRTRFSQVFTNEVTANPAQ
jgi:hypothetical protein